MSCYSNRSIISIGVFSGDHVKDTRPQNYRRHQFTTSVYPSIRGVATLGSSTHVPLHKCDIFFCILSNAPLSFWNKNLYMFHDFVDNVVWWAPVEDKPKILLDTLLATNRDPIPGYIHFDQYLTDTTRCHQQQVRDL